MLTIDDEDYDIPITELTRTAEFLDKYAERTEAGTLERDLIGVFFNYQLRLGSITDRIEYARLWDKLTEPVEFHTVKVPSEGEDDYTYTFTAYFSNVGDGLRKIDRKTGKTYWSGLTVNFIAKAPARS